MSPAEIGPVVFGGLGSDTGDSVRLPAAALRETFFQCDLLHVPVLRQPVPRAAETDVGGGAAMQEVLGQIVADTRSFNRLGLPSLSARATACRRRAARQPAFREDLLLRVGAAH